MKIGLHDAEMGVFPNLALMKISSYHKARGDEVSRWYPLGSYDKVYSSKVFLETCEDPYLPSYTIKGGTGYMLAEDKLPYDIESAYPDYSMYPNSRFALGFLTRGCPRNCPFCIVSSKEGFASQQVGELSDFWNGGDRDRLKHIKLLDPNILACVDAHKILDGLAGLPARIEFTQGLDIRLIRRDTMQLLNRINLHSLNFSWDDPQESLIPQFQQVKEWSRIKNKRKLNVYVLTNFNSELKQDLFRVYSLRDMGFNPYVMIYNKSSAPLEIRQLQRWVNNRRIFNSIDLFTDYQKIRGDNV